jgi:hypothetical protein
MIGDTREGIRTGQQCAEKSVPIASASSKSGPTMTRDTHKKASDLDSRALKRAKVKHAPSDLSEQLQDFVIDEVIGMLKRDKIITFTFKMLKLKLKSIASISQKDLVEPMTKIADVKAGVWTLKRETRTMFQL